MGGGQEKFAPILQVGNVVEATWRARLDEHLGSVTVEMIEPIASMLFDDALALTGLSSLCSLLSLFPERAAHQGLYKGAKLVLSHMEDEDIWPGLLVRFELEILAELGFQLDFSKCAATGVKEDLIYVSPKSGKAVSRDAGLPYKDKLLELPAFLRGKKEEGVSRKDILNGFALTGFFFERYVFNPGDQANLSAVNFKNNNQNADHTSAKRCEAARTNFLKRYKKNYLEIEFLRSRANSP